MKVIVAMWPSSSWNDNLNNPKFQNFELPTSTFLTLLLDFIHISMVSPRMVGPANLGELDFIRHTWAGILTSTTIPRVGNLTQPPS